MQLIQPPTVFTNSNMICMIREPNCKLILGIKKDIVEFPEITLIGVIPIIYHNHMMDIECIVDRFVITNERLYDMLWRL